jgi:hypothetical protein
MWLWWPAPQRLAHQVARVKLTMRAEGRYTVAIDDVECFEYIIPNGRRLRVLVDLGPEIEPRRREFIAKYLSEECGYTGEHTVMPFSWRIWQIKLVLTEGSPPAVPHGALLIVRPDGKSLTWRWPPDTPVSVVAREITALTGRPREEFISTFSPDISVIGQFVACNPRRIECVPRFRATAVYENEQFPVSELAVRDQVSELRKAVFRELNAHHPEIISPESIVLSASQDLSSPFLDSFSLTSLPRRIFVGCAGQEVSFRHSLRIYRKWFEPSQTVADARRFLANLLGLPMVDVVLLYSGKELRDSQLISRLNIKANTHVLVFDTALEEIELSSPRSSAEETKPYSFHQPENHDRFTISMCPSDLMDRVRLHVAQRYHVLPNRIILSFNNEIINDDTMIGRIGIGDGDSITVVLSAPLSMMKARTLGASSSLPKSNNLTDRTRGAKSKAARRKLVSVFTHSREIHQDADPGSTSLEEAWTSD